MESFRRFAASKNENVSYQRCSVCLEDMDHSKPIKLLKCEHSFHDECIAPWIRENATCPVCRVVVVEGGIIKETDSDDSSSVEYTGDQVTDLPRVIPGEHLSLEIRAQWARSVSLLQGVIQGIDHRSLVSHESLSDSERSSDEETGSVSDAVLISSEHEGDEDDSDYEVAEDPSYESDCSDYEAEGDPSYESESDEDDSDYEVEGDPSHETESSYDEIYTGDDEESHETENSSEASDCSEVDVNASIDSDGSEEDTEQSGSEGGDYSGTHSDQSSLFEDVDDDLEDSLGPDEDDEDFESYEED